MIGHEPKVGAVPDAKPILDNPHGDSTDACYNDGWNDCLAAMLVAVQRAKPAYVCTGDAIRCHDGHGCECEMRLQAEQQNKARQPEPPERIVLWARATDPEWYFVAVKSDCADYNGVPVYEALDPIVRRGSPEAGDAT